MRILWASNAPWAATGYGGQTKAIVKRIAEAGHEVAIAANYGLQHQMVGHPDLPGVPIYPAGTDAYSNDVLAAQFMHWARGKPTWLITLFDVWAYKAEYFADLPIASWTPVDHYPVPPQVLSWASGHRTIAMSRFGQMALERGRSDLDMPGVESTYIPHVVDRAIFTPRDKAQSRKEWGIPADGFVVLMNAANKGNFPPRKAWSENFGALAVFLDAHPDAYAYIHTDIVGISGVDLRRLASFWSIDPARLLMGHQYELKTGSITTDQMAGLYSACDVLLAVSMGEGFGVPTIEAQACGIPVIVSDWSAQPELVGAGWKVAVQPWYDVAHDAGFGTPLIGSIRAALENAYAARDDAGLRDAALLKAAEYDADAVYRDLWEPFLRGLDDSTKPVPLNRDQRRAAMKQKR